MGPEMAKLWSLASGDWVKGLLVAALTTPLTIAYQSFNAGSLTLDWKAIGSAAAAGGIAYLLKNFATGSGGQLLSNTTPPPKQ